MSTIPSVRRGDRREEQSTLEDFLLVSSEQPKKKSKLEHPEKNIQSLSIKTTEPRRFVLSSTSTTPWESLETLLDL